MLTFEGVSQTVAGQLYLAPFDLTLQPMGLTVLLGATQAGKTSLMRLMAGLDVPTQGRILENGQDVTGVPVRQRNVAMVYQQFINYPSMTVFENIASPLQLRGEDQIRERVVALAKKLHIDLFLDRLPSSLSGGQQQRVALARALVKNAPLLLLDEPLVNLDYKLREELREELSNLFAQGQSTVVYATTEPLEALLLGGYTAVLHEGQLLQYGPTLEVFQRPNSIRVAQAFNDPPMNLLPAQAHAEGLRLSSGLVCPLPMATDVAGELVMGIRASAVSLASQPGRVAVAAKVELSEVSGSDTYVHLQTELGALVMQLAGIHKLDLDVNLTVYFDPRDVYVFSVDGPLLLAPTERRGG